MPVSLGNRKRVSAQCLAKFTGMSISRRRSLCSLAEKPISGKVTMAASWSLMTCDRSRGTRAASRCMNSSGRVTRFGDLPLLW